MEVESGPLFGDLLRVEEPEGQEAWSQFLFNVAAAKKLVGFSPEEAVTVLQAGSRWEGCGWTTSRASRTLNSLTGVCLVASAVSAYRDAWLYALPMAWGVDVASLDLSDRAAEAAFALCNLLHFPRRSMEKQTR